MDDWIRKMEFLMYGFCEETCEPGKARKSKGKRLHNQFSIKIYGSTFNKNCSVNPN